MRTKTSALRRTFSALHQKITKRGPAKPPDWFLDKFSTGSHTEKIGKSSTVHDNDGAFSREITGESRLCNRLSVDPSLPSHYRVGRHKMWETIAMWKTFKCNPLSFPSGWPSYH